MLIGKIWRRMTGHLGVFNSGRFFFWWPARTGQLSLSIYSGADTAEKLARLSGADS